MAGRDRNRYYVTFWVDRETELKVKKLLLNHPIRPSIQRWMSMVLSDYLKREQKEVE